MTKAIWALIIVVLIYGGWQLFQYWEQVDNEEAIKKKAAAAIIYPSNLEGMPYQLEQSLQTAQQQGATALRNWLKTYGPNLKDPRKGWIELDFCVAVTREDPTEARRIFKEVKDRTPANSPIQPRLKQLQSAYE